MNKKEINNLEEYFYSEYQKQDIRVVPGHWPDFQTKEEIDKWIEGLQMHKKMMEELFKD